MRAKVVILPCPFCGQKPTFSHISEAAALPELPNAYWCLGCCKPSRTRRLCTANPISFGDTKAEAITEWNTRAPAKVFGAEVAK